MAELIHQPNNRPVHLKVGPLPFFPPVLSVPPSPLQLAHELLRSFPSFSSCESPHLASLFISLLTSLQLYSINLDDYRPWTLVACFCIQFTTHPTCLYHLFSSRPH